MPSSCTIFAMLEESMQLSSLMKKILILIVAALLVHSVASAQQGAVVQQKSTSAQSGISAQQQQSTVRFGIRAGGTASHIISKTPPGNWISRRQIPHWGYTAGLVVEFRVARMFSIQPELLVTLKGSKSEGEVTIARTGDNTVTSTAHESQTQNLTYLELPLRFMLKIPIQGHFLNISAGPYAAYGVRGVQRSRFTRNGANIDGEMTDRSLETKLFRGEDRLYRPWDVGLTASLGFEFDFGFFMDAGYGYGLITMDATKKYTDRNSSLSLSAGYKF